MLIVQFIPLWPRCGGPSPHCKVVARIRSVSLMNHGREQTVPLLPCGGGDRQQLRDSDVSSQLVLALGRHVIPESIQDQNQSLRGLLNGKPLGSGPGAAASLTPVVGYALGGEEHPEELFDAGGAHGRAALLATLGSIHKPPGQRPPALRRPRRWVDRPVWGHRQDTVIVEIVPLLVLRTVVLLRLLTLGRIICDTRGVASKHRLGHGGGQREPQVGGPLLSMLCERAGITAHLGLQPAAINAPHNAARIIDLTDLLEQPAQKLRCILLLPTEAEFRLSHELGRIQGSSAGEC
mmetsp:Transcript_45492/g.97177  ORF Transcript_45492/g.97177 Transcript_45492/m.97177 type:complete len:293 (+) Transcript_45492:446-1324(+)